ncbi:MAG: MarR family transcriptional regulator [FCB group bacterium]|jgi:DNA-binding MarR family transcriptional regulator
MKLEEEIKQKKFKSEYHKLSLNIVFTNSWIMNMRSRFFKKTGLTAQQYNILRILRGQYPNPANVNLLQDRMLEKMSNASRLVEKLRLKGFVERRENQDDRRHCDISITNKGLKILEDLDTKVDEMEEVFKSITKEEAQTLNKILDKLRG